MHNTLLPLEQLGQRICVFGPSSCGKSTLSQAIAVKLNIEAVHLDQIYHHEQGNWVPRDRNDFLRLYEEAIQTDKWIMDGNYSVSIPDRLRRATGIILISSNCWGNLWRYIARGLFEANRIGGLRHGQDTVITWLMVYHVLVVSPLNERRRTENVMKSGLPVVRVRGFASVKKLFVDWQLR